MDKQKKFYCPCNWGTDCIKYQSYFQSQPNHPLAGFKKIRISTSSKVTQLRSSIERHLKTKLNNLQCYVANHHWPEQLVIDQFVNTKSFPSTPLPSEVAKKYGIIEDNDRFLHDTDELCIQPKLAPQLMLKAPIASKETVRNLCNFNDDGLHLTNCRRKRK